MQRHEYPKVTGVEKWPNSVEEGVRHLRAYERIVVHPRCDHTAQEMRLYSDKVDRLTGDVPPDVVDRHNHIVDALRYALQPLIRMSNSGFGVLQYVLEQSAELRKQQQEQKRDSIHNTPGVQITPLGLRDGAASHDFDCKHILVACVCGHAAGARTRAFVTSRQRATSRVCRKSPGFPKLPAGGRGAADAQEILLQPRAMDESNCRLINAAAACPQCGAVARPNVLMFNDWSWCNSRKEAQAARQEEWLLSISRPVVVELGSGTEVPTVRRFSERIARQVGGRLIRINPREPGVPTKSDVGLAMNALDGIKAIAGVLGADWLLPG